MTGQVRLIGHADTVGKSVGFLIPVFDREGSNSLLVQRISADRKILDFEEVQNMDVRIEYVDPAPVMEGQESIWSFALSAEQIISGRYGQFRNELADCLNEETLADRPLLSIEVAEFLGLRDKRLELAGVALKWLNAIDSKSAKDWLDLSILTPDVRQALARAYPDSSINLRRIVATVEGGQIIVRGAKLRSEDPGGFGLERAIHNVMRELRTLYPAPRQGWSVRLIESDAKSLTPEPQAVVWLMERADGAAQTYIQDDFSWRVDAYRADEFEEYRAATEVRQTEAFVVLRRGQDKILQEIQNLVGKKRVIPIEFGSLSHLRLEGPDLYKWRSSPGHIFVPTPGLPGTRISPKTMGATVRQVIAGALALEDERLVRAFEGAWLFFRATGNGAAPSADAWATVYDRVWASGLSSRQIYRLGGRDRASRFAESDPGWAKEILFPSAFTIKDRRVDSELRKARVDAAILLPVERRDGDDLSTHTACVEAVLVKNGWEPRGVTRDVEATTLEFETRGALRFVRTQIEEAVGKPRWDFADCVSQDLSSIDTMVVTGEASAAAILGHLFNYRELAVNVRDMCSASVEGGIWSVLGSQLRRLSSGQMNRARTHFVALLIADAFKKGRVDFEDDGELSDAIRGPTIGSAVQFSWSRVRQSPNETSAMVRMLSGMSNQYLPSGRDITQPFEIILDRNGVAVVRDQGARSRSY